VKRVEVKDSTIESSPISIVDVSVSIGILAGLLGLLMGMLLCKKLQEKEEPAPKATLKYDAEDARPMDGDDELFI